MPQVGVRIVDYGDAGRVIRNGARLDGGGREVVALDPARVVPDRGARSGHRVASVAVHSNGVARDRVVGDRHIALILDVDAVSRVVVDQTFIDHHRGVADVV